MSLCGKIISNFLRISSLTLVMSVILTFTIVKRAQAQQTTGKNSSDTTLVSLVDTLEVNDTLKNDSLKLVSDTLSKDTSGVTSLEDSLGIKISPDALPSVVTSVAKDSAVLNMQNNLFYLYGDAQVNYEELQLNAGEIVYNQRENIVTAAPQFDTLGRPKQVPSFTQGQEKFTYDSLKYNFKSKRAIVRNARSQYGEGFVHSMQVKRNPDQTIYGLNNVYTTCALDTPHFGIRARRIKIIPNKVVASGAANIELMQVPTPVFLPFGLFPISQTQRSGLKLPTYTIEERRGLGLVGGGYYFYLSDQADLLMSGNVYSKGSWSLSGISTYTSRYRFNGGLSFAYAYNKDGETYEPGFKLQKDFQTQWRHASDPKSRPGVNFNANVLFGTSTFNQNNSYEVNQILQNQYNSSVSYSKNWLNKPYTLTVAARHSQNTQTGNVEVALPEVGFIATINPFQSKTGLGTKWYEKITIPYRLDATNRLYFIDSTFILSKLSTNDFRNQIKHTIPVTASYNILRYINMNVGVSYNEYWMKEQLYQRWNADSEEVDSTTHNGFFAARDFNANFGLNTRIYGIKMFKRGKLAGIRHVLYPTASFVYTPDFAASPFNYYYRTITDPNLPPAYRSVYESSANMYGVPGLNTYGKYSSMMNFGIDNNLQIKVRTNDSVGTKNIRLIDNFRINTGYNLSADSFRWSAVDMSFATNLFEVLNITAGAVFDPYDFDTARLARSPRTLLDNGTGIVRFNRASISLNGSFRSKPVDNDGKSERKSDEYERLLQYGGYYDYVDFNIPWMLNVSYSLNINPGYDTLRNRDTLRYDHTFMFNGNFNLTPRWKFEMSSGYNFTTNKLVLAQISIYRDLHCWEMRLSAVPFGIQRNFNFTLNVKAHVLQDLKLVRRRDYRDAVY